MADLYAGMFFALGFLTAGLVALMLAPALWRRAVRLTRRRIEAATPLTLTEIRADKDQLRADFALTARRLEMSVLELKHRAAEQLVEIERKREAVRALTAERDDKAARIADLEARERRLRGDLRDREDELGRATLALRDAERLIDVRTQELTELDERLKEVRGFVDGQKLEIVARSTKIETLEASLATMKTERAAETARMRTLEADLRLKDAQIAAERDRIGGLEAKLTRIAADLADRETAIEIGRRQIARLQDELRTAEVRIAEMEAQATDLSRRRVEAESEATDLRARALVGADAPAARTEAERERERRVAELRAARARLTDENDALRRGVGEAFESDRSDQAVVRERLNDVAAEVHRITAALDGDPVATERMRAEAVPSDTRRAPRPEAAE